MPSRKTNYTTFTKSDLYLYIDKHGGYQCRTCKLHPVGAGKKQPPTQWFSKLEDLLAHVMLHVEKGHHVPQTVIDDIKADIKLT